jgi:hypothetical protein
MKERLEGILRKLHEVESGVLGHKTIRAKPRQYIDGKELSLSDLAECRSARYAEKRAVVAEPD